jgi:hypothetical protein
MGMVTIKIVLLFHNYKSNYQGVICIHWNIDNNNLGDEAWDCFTVNSKNRGINMICVIVTWSHALSHLGRWLLHSSLILRLLNKNVDI